MVKLVLVSKVLTDQILNFRLYKRFTFVLVPIGDLVIVHCLEMGNNVSSNFNWLSNF